MARNNIKQYRQQHNLSTSQLARASGISRPYLYLLENGDGNPTADKLLAIASVFGILVSELIGELEDGLPDRLPDGLHDFASQVNLPYHDVVMLSQLGFQGRQPSGADNWRTLYYLIVGICE